MRCVAGGVELQIKDPTRERAETFVSSLRLEEEQNRFPASGEPLGLDPETEAVLDRAEAVEPEKAKAPAAKKHPIREWLASFFPALTDDHGPDITTNPVE